uniref:Uncharacterized protein n=1 Tax=Myoviridae sp. ct9dX1 TaxID=2827665 RepID=A0A8S5TIV8_9CAUD|nr:MAG TPA: hypothetical protein [Myoviridae sp. ct9dX1]
MHIAYVIYIRDYRLYNRSKTLQLNTNDTFLLI